LNNNFSTIGNYNYIFECNSTNYGGFINAPIVVTTNGFDLSEHIFPNEIYEQVRTKLGDHMQAFNIKFVWQSIGNMNSVAVGEGRLMRFKLLS
jgi:hypothetical protein